ncbi:MAG: PadR family transcriptional regulator [Candidatus Odinarchaeia archaeon]
MKELPNPVHEFFNKPKRAILKALILSLLNVKEAHGYEIMKKIENKTEKIWKPPHSMIYSELKNLEDAGVIKGTEKYKGKIRIKKYSITEYGRRILSKITLDLVKLFDFYDELKRVDYPLFNKIMSVIIENLRKMPPNKKLESLKLLQEHLVNFLEVINEELKKINI